MMDGLILEFEKRPGDWLVFLSGNRTVWGCGATLQAALNDWTRTHGETYGVAPEPARGTVLLPIEDATQV